MCRFAKIKIIRVLSRIAVLAAVSTLAACQGSAGSKIFSSADGNNGERPVQLVNAAGSQTSAQGSGGFVSSRQAINEKELAKAVERYRLNKKQKQSPYRSVGIDLNGDGQAEALTLLEGPDWCTKTGCTLAIFTKGKRGYRPVATIRRARGPVVLTNERNNGWSDLVVNTGIYSRNQRVRLRFGSNGYPGNAVILTPMPADIDVNGEVVIEHVELMAQEMVSNSKP